MFYRLKKLSAILLAAGLLAGCAAPGVPTRETEEPEYVTVWNYYNGPQKERFDLLVQRFNETEGLEKKIVVEAVSMGNLGGLVQAISESAEEQIGSAKLPQLCAAYADTALELDQKGLLADIRPYLTQEELDTYVDAYLEEGSFSEDGSLKIFPTAKSTEVMTLNQTAWAPFSEATGTDISELFTWEGVARTAERYYQWTDAQTPEPEDGRAFFGRDALANYMLAGSSQLGHDVLLVKDGELVLDFDREAMKRLWDAYYLPYIKGYYNAEGKFRSDAMSMGSLIAYVGATSGAPYTPKKVVYEDGSSQDIECVILPAPNFEGTEPIAVQQGGGMVLFQGEERTERAAVEFLKWFTQAETNLEFCVGSGYLPVQREANSVEVLDRAIAEAELEISDVLRESLVVGMTVVDQCQLYTMKPTTFGNEVRALLADTIAAQAEEDRAEVEALLQSGRDLSQAVEELDPDARFEEWYNKTYETLKGISA